MTGPIAGLLLLFLVECGAGIVTLGWDKNSEPNVVGYYVCYGIEPNPNKAADSVTVYVDGRDTTQWQGAVGRGIHFFTLQATNSLGGLSKPSNQIAFWVPGDEPAPPQNAFAPVGFGHSIAASQGATVTDLVNEPGNVLYHAWGYTAANPWSYFPYDPFLAQSSSFYALYAVLVPRHAADGSPTLPTQGELVLNTDGTFRYTPRGSIKSTNDSFDFVIKGILGTSLTNTVAITIDTGIVQQGTGLGSPAANGKVPGQTPLITKAAAQVIVPGSARHLDKLIPAPVPVRLTPMLKTNGVFALKVEAETGRSYQLQVSTNLVDWTDWLTANPTSDSSTWIDPNPPSEQKFYRAKRF
jgi:hypothetical protein